MKILYSPQRSDKTIYYEFSNEVITVKIDNQIDVFDFRETPNGMLEKTETTLKVNPILSAERKEGELYVTLLKYIDKDAIHEERFPQWQVIE